MKKIILVLFLQVFAFSELITFECNYPTASIEGKIETNSNFNFRVIYDSSEKEAIITGNNGSSKLVVIENQSPGITFIDKIYEEDDVALVPWLVGDEWKKIKNIKAKYLFGHFELPSFYMNAMVQMPDTGELQATHFENQEYVFSGHFHKRQQQGKVHYLGNAFPHNYADAWDDDRGMMILDRENNKEPEYINWDNCPKYRTIGLKRLLEDTDAIIKPKMYLRVTIDVPISFEEATFIKETFVNQYKCREISLIPQKQMEEITTDVDIQHFESVDQIVAGEIAALDTENFNKKMLLDIYNEL